MKRKNELKAFSFIGKIYPETALRILEFAGRDKSGQAMFACECVLCRRITTIQGGHLGRHNITCGCLGKVNRLTHGGAQDGGHTPEYSSYRHMLERCYNPRATRYKDWGGRGIRVCKRWRDSFENFLKDMGKRPAGHSIHRLDNDGNDCPSNVKWATAKEQAGNKRRYRKAA